MAGANSTNFCECGCGTEIAANRRFVTHHNFRTHGLSSRPEHKIWSSMIERCDGLGDPLKEAYYTNRGITVCERWLASFANFFADMGPRPPGGSIDRIDGTRGYEPGNCRWATIQQQNTNRVICRRIDAFGESKTAPEWARDPRAKAKHATIYARVFVYGWSAEEAICTPARRIAPVTNRWWKRGRNKRKAIYSRPNSG